MRKTNPTYLLFLLLLTSRCSIPIDSEDFDYQRSIVVDGLITNEFKEHEVSIQYSNPITGSQDQALSATVWVETGTGEIINYHQSLSTFVSEEPFAGKPGESYQLHFVLENGAAYESNMSQLIRSPKIDSIYDRYAELAPEGAVQNEGGIQFFLDTHDETGAARYFRYDWIEDYKIITPFKAIDRYIYSEDRIYPIVSPRNICYGQNQSKSVLLANSLETNHRISEFPLRFVSGQTDVLRHRYTLYVRQYALNRDTYNYYRKFKQLNEANGSLFDQQQGELPGNVLSLNDPSEVVLGYFDVAGVSDKRVFFSFDDLDPNFSYPDYRTSCGPQDKLVTDPLSNPLNSFGIDLNILEYDGTTGQPVIGPLPCSDCTNYGPVDPPDYWVE